LRKKQNSTQYSNYANLSEIRKLHDKRLADLGIMEGVDATHTTRLEQALNDSIRDLERVGNITVRSWNEIFNADLSTANKNKKALFQVGTSKNKEQ